MDSTVIGLMTLFLKNIFIFLVTSSTTLFLRMTNFTLSSDDIINLLLSDFCWSARFWKVCRSSIGCSFSSLLFGDYSNFASAHTFACSAISSLENIWLHTGLTAYCTLDLSLNLEITKPLSNQVSLSRFIGTVFTFGEERSITSLIHSFSAFLIGFVSFFRMAVISLTVVWLWPPLRMRVVVKEVSAIAVVDGRH